MNQTVAVAVSTEYSSRIPKPSPDRPPLRVNAYEFLASANTSLLPFFPYVERGAIVPAGNLVYGGPDRDYGHFYHQNTEEEVVLTMGERGALKGTGTIMNTPLEHGVNSFLKDPADPESFLCNVIVQRQRESGPQSERFYIRCGCNEIIYSLAFDGTPGDVYDPRIHSNFKTLGDSARGVDEFNSDESVRTCKRCGKIAAPFPRDTWGWNRHDDTYRFAMKAEQTLQAAVKEAGL
jgi:hypothetical protein